MLFISRVIIVMFILASGANATTLAIPMDEMGGGYEANSFQAKRFQNQSFQSKSLQSKSLQSKSLQVEGKSQTINNVSTISALSSTTNSKTVQPVLLLRISFTDQDFTHSRSEFEHLMFSKSASANSVARYYLENSYQQFHIEPALESQGDVNDGIIDVRLPYAHPNFGDAYGSRSQALVADALAQAKDSIDLSAFDKNGDNTLSSNELAIVLMVAGYENAYGGSSAPEPRVWAHKSDMQGVSFDGVTLTSFAMFGEQHQNHLATIGIISHEMGHLLFALPDLYDRQGKSNGIGRWGLMGLGTWNANGGYSGSSPAHMMAWSKEKAGFLKPQDIVGNEFKFDLASATHEPEAMRVWVDPFRHGEHFLLEYRQQSQLDSALPGEGLVITHIDDRVGYGAVGSQNDVAEHKLVDIEEADGRNDLDQQENRGDSLDVFNDAYGQDYFGASSFPSSVDYQGNVSGVEISNIRIGERVQGDISLPYATLGDNLGHDSVVGASWGVKGKKVSSLVTLPLNQDLPWAHGIDIYSPGAAELDVALYASLSAGQLGDAVYTSLGHSVVEGWNRITFDQSIDMSNLDQVYMQVSVQSDSARPFGIDNQSQASGFSYVESNGFYQKAGFDFNQRLLVAGQEQSFDYKAPQGVSAATGARGLNSKVPTGGNALSIFALILLLLSIRGRR